MAGELGARRRRLGPDVGLDAGLGLMMLLWSPRCFLHSTVVVRAGLRPNSIFILFIYLFNFFLAETFLIFFNFFCRYSLHWWISLLF